MKEGGEIEEDLVRAQNQVALVAVCELKGLKGEGKSPPVIIATTHLKSSRSATGERYRLKEILQVLGVIENIQTCLQTMDRPGACIFAGDFNSVPDSKIFEPLTYRAIKNHRSLSFRSVYTEDLPYQPSQGDYLPHTFLSVVSKGGVEEVIKRCIDYIFYTPFKPLPPPTPQSVIRLKRGMTTDLLITLLVRSLYYLFVCSIASACIIESTVEHPS